jgi:YfiH family protein
MPRLSDTFLRPDWPAPARVQAVTTTRQGGVSSPPFDGLNLAAHVGDAPEAVTANRAILAEALNLPAKPQWLQQVHGTEVALFPGNMAAPAQPLEADASCSDSTGQVCAVLTADCLPVLFCDGAGSRVAAAHAGWRGLAAGVLEATLEAMQVAPHEILAWLGPAIGPKAFEVGEEVREVFMDQDPAAAGAFSPRGAGHWLADIYGLARLRLQAAGVGAVYGGGLCTYQDAARFFSYRRDGKTGRMASLIWLAESA